jgi:Polyprenyl synthetase
MEPFSYITSTPGKDFRGGMTQAFNAWLHVPESKLQVIGHVISMLHNASLLCVSFNPSFPRQLLYLMAVPTRIDDIEDNSQLRRGVPGSFPGALHSTISDFFPLFFKSRTRYMVFHRLSILRITCIS